MAGLSREFSAAAGREDRVLCAETRLGNEILKRAAAHFARENVLAKLRNTQTRGDEVPNRFRIGVVGGSVAGWTGRSPVSSIPAATGPPTSSRPPRGGRYTAGGVGDGSPGR